MKYIGEHLLPGQLGHFFAILSFVASLVATISYFTANRRINVAEKQSWLRFARSAFLVETIAVFGIFGTLYFIISNHYYEYFYAWNHTSRSLQSQYLLASFWEGLHSFYSGIKCRECLYGIIQII